MCTFEVIENTLSQLKLNFVFDQNNFEVIALQSFITSSRPVCIYLSQQCHTVSSVPSNLHSLNATKLYKLNSVFVVDKIHSLY